MQRIEALSHALLAASVVVLTMGSAGEVRAQAASPDSTAVPVATPGPAAEEPPPAAGLPIFLTVGLGYGQRFDPCAQCASPQNLDSFTGHLSLGKYVMPGLGIGVEASAWRRGHPGLPMAADSAGAGGTPTTLVNQLANASVALSYETWHVFVHAGVGIAMGQQDVQDTEGSIAAAKGMGVGYTFGGGATLPLASMVSLAVFANWNVGSYDLATPTQVLERGVRHEFVELGFGLTTR